jgi:hypothetical protein
MKRPLLIVCLVVASTVIHPRPASAGFWAWLSEFSGPGPFKGWGFLLTGCFVDGKLKPSPVAQDSGNTEKHPPCVYFDKGLFNVDADSIKGFPKIDTSLNDFGGSVRLVDGLDIGGGLGWISFDSGETHRKFTVTPIRLVTRPLLLATPPGFLGKNRHYLGVLSVYWKEVFVSGDITGEDFGVAAAKFRSKGESVSSFGIVFDATALLRFGR